MSPGTPNAATGSSNVLDGVFEAASDAADGVRSFLASERGKRMRRQVATALIVAAPVISELPVIRRHPIARVLRAAGVAAMVVKGAEWLRDWEPQALPEF
jgi:hypothetical protein